MSGREVASGVVLASVSFALCIDMLAYGAILPLLPSIGAGAELGQTAMGVVVATYALALALVTPVLARATDRGPRAVLVAGAALAVASSLVFTLPPALPTLLAARALQGVSAGASWTAAFAAVAVAFPSERRGAAMGAAIAATAVGTALGPLVAGLLYDRAGARVVFGTLAGLALVSGVVQAVVLPGNRAHTGAPSNLSALRSPGARVAAGIVFFAALAITFLEPTVPYRTASGGAQARDAGLVLFAGAGANAVAAPVASWLTAGRAPLRIARVGAVVTVAGALLAAAAGSLWTLTLACVVLGLGFGSAMAPALPALADAVESAGSPAGATSPPPFGAAYAAFNAAYAAGMILGPPLGSAIAERFGFSAAMLVLAVGAATAAMLIPLARR